MASFQVDFDKESQYWPSYLMVLPENTDLDDKRIEAIIIYNDYGTDKEQNPIGYNISYYKQDGITVKNKSILSVEDSEEETLYLEDANSKCIAYSIYNYDSEIFQYFIKSFDSEEGKLVAQGDAEKLSSYATVAGTEIFWVESDGDAKKIFRDAEDGKKELLVGYENAYVVMIESYSDEYIAYYVENFDTAYNLISNEIVVFDIVANTELKVIDIDDNYELSSANYDGVNAFFSAYDYGTEMYVHGKALKNGTSVIYEESENNDYTVTGNDNHIFFRKDMEGLHEGYYYGRKLNLDSEEELEYNDLLNASIANGYFYYISCDVNYDNLIDNIYLNVFKLED
jgi:hypothetical protein